MAYCTREELKEILSSWDEDGNDNHYADELSDAQLDFAIASADAEIDGTLRRRYQVPFPADQSVPALVHTLSIDIAAYQADLIFAGQNGVSSTQPAILRYERARRLLQDLRSGRIDIDAVELIDSESALQAVFNDYNDPLFPMRHIFGGTVGYVDGVIPPDRTYP